MHSKFYSPDDKRAGKVRELFAAIARRYDLVNDLISAGQHRRWKRRVARLAGNPQRALDLCCGTGDIAMRLRAQLVVGADFTVEMLGVAKSRCRPDVAWVQADALRLPFADNSFDAVTVGYGLRNLSDIRQGLSEALRVLRPGGVFVSLDFGKPESQVAGRFYFGYLRAVLPVFGRIFCGDADTYGYIFASLAGYPGQRGLKTIMESLGYRDCGFDEFVAGAMAINFGRKPK